MKIGTFTEARRSLVEKFHKNVLGHRGVITALWCQLALLIGMSCLDLILYSVIRGPTASVVAWTGYGIFVIGLPILALVFGICGILPGTRRKNKSRQLA